jgi:hypothetical protein
MVQVVAHLEVFLLVNDDQVVIAKRLFDAPSSREDQLVKYVVVSQLQNLIYSNGCTYKIYSFNVL